MNLLTCTKKALVGVASMVLVLSLAFGLLPIVPKQAYAANDTYETHIVYKGAKYKVFAFLTDDGNVYGADATYLGPINKSRTTYNIPQFITFKYNSKRFSSGVTYLGKKAFKGCTKVKKIRSGITMMKVSKDTFSSCKNLRTFIGYYAMVGNRAFAKCKKLTKVNIKYIVQIGNEAFSGCKKLKTVKSEMLSYIGKKAFYKCENLNSVRFGDSGPNKIGKSAFEGCSKLKSISPISLSYDLAVSNRAFYGCKNLKSITFKSGDSSTKLKIGYRAFMNCTNLSKISFSNIKKNNKPTVVFGKDSFENCKKLVSIHNLVKIDYVVRKHAFLNTPLQKKMHGR